MPPLRCFSRVELVKPGLAGRLLRRKPSENCFVDIQNLLASRLLGESTAADVENILSEYELPRPEASARLISHCS